jgi:hypothetical protein
MLHLAHAYLEPSAASGVGQGHGDRYQIDGIKFQTPKCKVCRGLPANATGRRGDMGNDSFAIRSMNGFPIILLGI